MAARALDLARLASTMSSAVTIRGRLSALSSLFGHLVAHRITDEDPVRKVEHPGVNRRTSNTASSSNGQAPEIRRGLSTIRRDSIAGPPDRRSLPRLHLAA